MDAYMGRYVKTYKPKTFSINRIIHNLFGFATFATEQITLQQTKKFPDVSFYQGLINWEIMKTMTDAVIIRAGQNLWPDEQFDRNWREAKRLGIKRGVYWFYDDRIDPIQQANILISQIQDDLPEMEVVMDWERSYGGAFSGLENVVAFMQQVETTLPIRPMAMYTGYYWFVDHSNPITNSAQYNYLKDKPLWLAWYTSDTSLIIIPRPWTFITIWQFGTPAIGIQYGVVSREIDMNYFNGSVRDFNDRYAVDAINYPFPNFPEVKQITGTRKGYRFWLHILEKGKVRYQIPTLGSTRVSTSVRNHGAQIGWNGSDFDRITRQLNDRHELGLNIRPDDTIDIVPDGDGIYGVHWLIKDGVINPRLYWTDPTATEGHSRTVHAVDAEGNHLAFTGEGIYPNQGWVLKDIAEFLLQKGAVKAFDAGGGGDTTLVVDNVVLNKPEDIDNGINVERLIPQVLLMFTKGESMFRFEATALGDGTRLRSDHNTAATYTNSYARGTKFHGDTLFTATQELRNSSGVVYQKVGDVWLEVKDVNGTPATGWVAIVHMGFRYCDLVDSGTTPEEPYLKHTIEIWSDGSVKIDGNPIP